MLCYICLLALVGHAFGQYLGDDYPYMKGPLEVDSETFVPLTPVNPIPIYTRVWYPQLEGSFPVWYFITGYGGAFPSGAYGDIITRIVSHGFIVAGTWALFGVDGPDFSTQAHLDNIEWLKENLNDRIPAKASWDHMTFGCHSAGCGRTYEMERMHPKIAKATVHIEPVSSAILAGVDFVQPAIILGAGIAGSCGGSPNNNFERFYSEWTCPKIKLEVKDVGHCDCLDLPAWDACAILEICETGEKALMQRYRDFLGGMTTAFMRAFVMHDADSAQYFLDPAMMPMELDQHEYEVECKDT